jgi:hypothetical protein
MEDTSRIIYSFTGRVTDAILEELFFAEDERRRITTLRKAGEESIENDELYDEIENWIEQAVAELRARRASEATLAAASGKQPRRRSGRAAAATAAAYSNDSSS